MSHILHAYQVTVRRKRDKEEQLLGNFDEEGSDLVAVFARFFRDPTSQDWLDSAMGLAARSDAVYGPDPASPDIIAAMIKSGETGVTSEMVLARGDQLDRDVAFHRQPEHAELVPVLVLAELPGTRTKGFLVCHSPHGRGIKTSFWRTFTSWFGDNFPSHIIDLSPAYPSQWYRRAIEQEGLKQVTLIRQMRPSDMMDADRQWFDEENVGTVRTVITPRKLTQRLRKTEILKFLQGDKDLESLLVFHGVTYEEIRTTFVDGQGRKHSIHLSEEGSSRAPRAGLDVSDQLKKGEDGQPTYESLRQAALEYINLLIEVAGGTT